MAPGRTRRSTEPEPVEPSAVLTASAQRVTINVRGKANVGQPERWQAEAWDVYDLVGEVKQATNFLANVVRGVQLFIGEIPDDPEEHDPMPAPAGTPGAFEAEMVLERLRMGSTHGGLSGLLAESVVNLKVAGEYYLLGEPAKPGNPEARDVAAREDTPESWDVRSIDEVEVKDRGIAKVKDRPGNEGREIRYAPASPDIEEADDIAFLIRVWQRHPRYSALADCALRAVLAECDELLLLSRSIRGTARSRLASKGIAMVANEYSIPAGPDEGDMIENPESDPFMRRFAKAVLDAINDESSPEGQVPIIVRGPKDVIKDAPIQIVKFDQTFDPEAAKVRGELIGRLGHSLDIPIEQLTGLANVNHWTAWQVDGASWARYGHPTTGLICESWTEGLLWPMLEAAGIDPMIARRLVIWFDPADAIVDPDEKASAKEAFDRGAISWDAYRRRMGFGDDEAADDAELDRRAELGLLKSGGRPEGDGVGPPGSDGSAGPARAITAATKRKARLGDKLVDVDRRLRTRLTELAEAAMTRALERAGAKVRSRAQAPKHRTVAAAISTVAAHEVCRRLDPSILAALGLTEDELVDQAVDEAQPRFDSRMQQAQQRARRLTVEELDLDDEDEAAMERQQDKDRQAAWLWFSGAMTALVRDRLFAPPPATGQGEFDATTSVPTSIIREAMAVGGGGMPPAGEPMGGVGTGRLVLDAWAKAGRVVGGWEWVYGDPGSRTSPFPGHEALDGVEFGSWSDPVLLVNDEDSWLGVTHYRPGDHDWCQCDFVPLGPDEAAPTEDDRVGELMDALDA